MTDRRWDLILVGGGLANGLIAWRLHQLQPSLRLLMLEAQPQPAGNHTWSYHQNDLLPVQHQWIAPLVSYRWEGYEVRFPSITRFLPGAYFSITSGHFAEALGEALGGRLMTNTPVLALTPNSVTLPDGKTWFATAVIDGRGYLAGPHLTAGYQTFLGQQWRLGAPHGLTHPVLMDATVSQSAGYRFVYTLPLSATELLLEDTHYIDKPVLDLAQFRQHIRQYATRQGWQLKVLEREERGNLPIALTGDCRAFWQYRMRQPCSGLRAGLFHATTGYSLPHAVALADGIARQPLTDADALFKWIMHYARRQWQRQRFFRALNRMLFLAGPAECRWQVMQRFYGLDAGLIARFYAGKLTLLDMAKLLTGKPPVPPVEAVRAVCKFTLKLRAFDDQ